MRRILFAGISLGAPAGACYFSMVRAVEPSVMLFSQPASVSFRPFFFVGALLLLGCGGGTVSVKEPASGGEVAPDAGDTESKAASSERSSGGERVSSESAPVALRHPRGSRPWLGVELGATEPSEPGVEIVRVLPGSPAEAAQFQSGDILIQMGESPATSPTDVATWVRGQDNGVEHPMAVLRGGETHLLRAKLEGLPDFEDRLRLAFVGKTAPEINGVITFQGEAASLKDLSGQVVVLEFWGSFCGVCRFLAPMLDDWSRRYGPQGLEVMGITTDNPKVGMEVARKTGMGYTLASDPDAKVTRAYMASQIPTLLILDRKGVVRDVTVGYHKDRLSEARSLIEELLRQ